MIYQMVLDVGGMKWGAQAKELVVAYEYARAVVGASATPEKQGEILGGWLGFLTGEETQRAEGPLTIIKREDGNGNERKVEEKDKEQQDETGAF